MMIIVKRAVRAVILAMIFVPLILSQALGARQCPPDSAPNQAPRKTLLLFAKDPGTWKIIPHGAKGILSFNENTGRFTFTAAKLVPLKGYSLVRHDDGETLGDLLAKGLTDSAGRLSLTGTWQLWRGKVWLVPTDHTAEQSGRLRLTAWRPAQVLFEEKVLGVVYPCSTKK
jgi:hypothetical protein